MQVITGRVVHGKIEVDAPLAEGAAVAVLAADEAGFHLTAEQEEELAGALAEIRSGNFVDGRELLAEIKALKP